MDVRSIVSVEPEVEHNGTVPLCSTSGSTLTIDRTSIATPLVVRG